MGIRGLFSFVDSYDDDFFEEVRLSNQKIVIDGSNLRYLLYHWCPGMNDCFGGDYAKFYGYVTDFFTKLLSCGLIPVVVMDGAHDTSGVKKATVIRRAKDQVRNAVACGEKGRLTSKGTKFAVVPLFALDVFYRALRQLDVTLMQTNFEADSYLAELAQAENCSVASNDSDFFVYDVDFVPLDAFRFSTVEIGDDNSRYLSCRRFNKAKFLRTFNLTTNRHLYLFSSVLGNDYIPLHAFEKFFSQVKMPKKKTLDKRKKMLGFLHWLSREPDVSKAIGKIMSHINTADRPRLKALIESSMAVYESGDLAGSTDSNAVSDCIEVASGATLPAWFVCEFRACRYPNWTLDALCNGLFVLTSQVESRNSASSHLFALPVLSTTLSLCHSLDDVSNGIPDAVTAYTREGGTSKATPVALQPGKTHLSSLREAGDPEKETFMCSVFDLELPSDIQFPTGMEILSLALAFWTQKTSGGLPVTMWKSLAFSWFLSLFEPKQKELRDLPCLSKIVCKLDDISQAAKTKAIETLSRFRRTNVELKKYTLDAVHMLANLQATLYHANVLNRLVDNKWTDFNPASMFNGTLIFNLHHDLETYCDIDNRCEALLGFDDDLVQCHRDLLNILAPFTAAVSDSGRSDGRKGKRARKRDKRGHREQASADNLTNRFASLDVASDE